MIHSIKHISDDSVLGLWLIDEPLEDLEDQVKLEEDISGFHQKKQFEYLSARLLLQKLCYEVNIPFNGLWKDEHGKPHFKRSDTQLSISHSHPWVSCMLHRKQPCGIDIESPRTQLLNIRHKFLTDNELNSCGENLNELCRYWAAKEAVYKIFGRKYLSFKKDIFIKESVENGLIAEVKRDSKIDLISLTSIEIEKYYLVYGSL